MDEKRIRRIENKSGFELRIRAAVLLMIKGGMSEKTYSCREILLQNGAERVEMFALGKAI